MAWRSVSVTVEAASLDELTELLESLGALSVTFAASDDAGAVLEPAPGETPLWSSVRVDALFEAGADLATVEQAIASAFDRLGEPPPSLDVRWLEDADWSNTWRQFAGPLTFGGRLTVVPRDWTGAIEGVALHLDPGLAFGTGTHPTTALCLDWLSRNDLTECTVVDFGCGSGILAIAALCLGAGCVDAVDYDPQARLATCDNAAYNDHVEGLQTRLRVLAPEAVGTEPRDIVVANILADPLIALAAQLTTLVRVGGRLVLSGMRADQLERVLRAYPDFHFRAPELRDGWVAIEGTRTGA